MGLYNRILVAVDGSDDSLHALSESIKLSYWVRGSVCAIYVAPSYEGDLSLTGVKDLKALLSEPCEIALAKIKKTVEKIDTSIEALCVEGEPFEKIIEYAETKGFDLIVTGITKKNTLYRALIKGVTEKIIRFGSKDVLAIPENTLIGWDKILILTNGSQASRIAAIRAIEIAGAYGGELLLLSVSGSNAVKTIKKTEGYIKDIKNLSLEIANKSFVGKGDAAKAITNTAIEHNADLIVIGSFGEKTMKKLFCESTAEKVIYSSPCPVLVVKNGLSDQ